MVIPDDPQFEGVDVRDVQLPSIPKFVPVPGAVSNGYRSEAAFVSVEGFKNASWLRVFLVSLVDQVLQGRGVYLVHCNHQRVQLELGSSVPGGQLVKVFGDFTKLWVQIFVLQ